MMKHGRQLSFNINKKKDSIQKWKQTSKSTTNDTKKVVSDLAALDLDDHDHHEQPLQEISFDDTKSTLSSNSLSSTLSLHRSDDDTDGRRRSQHKKKSNHNEEPNIINVVKERCTTTNAISTSMDRIGCDDGDVVVDNHRDKFTTTSSNQHSTTSRRKLLIQNSLNKHDQTHSLNKQSSSSTAFQTKASITTTPNNDNDNGNDNTNVNTTNDMSRNIYRSFSSSKLLMSQRRNTFHKATSRSSSVRDLSKTLHDRACSSFHKMMMISTSHGGRSQREQQHPNEQYESQSYHEHDLQKKEKPQQPQPQLSRQHTKLKRTKKSQSFVYRSCPTTMIVIICTMMAISIMSSSTTMVLAHPVEYNMSPLEGSSLPKDDDSTTLDYVNPFATDSMYSPMLDTLRGHKGKHNRQHSDQKMLSKYGYQHTWNSNEHGFLLPIPTKGKRTSGTSHAKKSKKKGNGDDNTASNVSSDSTTTTTPMTENNNSSSYLMTFMEIKSLEKCAQKCSTIDAISGGFDSNKQTCYCHRRKRQSHAGSDGGKSRDYKYCRELPAKIQWSFQQNVQIFTSLSNKPPKCPKSVCLHYYSTEYCQRSKKEVPPPGVLQLPPIPFSSSDSEEDDYDYYFDYANTKYWYHQTSAVLQDSRGSDGSGGRNGAAALSTTSSTSSATSLLLSHNKPFTVQVCSVITITITTTLLYFVLLV